VDAAAESVRPCAYISLYASPQGEELANSIAVKRAAGAWSVALRVKADSWQPSAVPTGSCISWLSAYTDVAGDGYITYMTEECSAKQHLRMTTNVNAREVPCKRHGRAEGPGGIRT
jgi:hypothetical protein